MPTVAMTGATGFIGTHLLKSLLDNGMSVRALSRTGSAVPGARSLRGNLLDPGSLDELLDSARVVVNLAFARDAPAEVNLKMGANLARACVSAGAEHLIHCSTAVVTGPGGPEVVTEATPCRPETPYQQAKYNLEQTIHRITVGQVLTTCLRPTAVFGPGGRNLVPLIRSVIGTKKAVNVWRSVLQGNRSMNLVPVEDVVAAVQLLIQGHKDGKPVFPGGPLIVSADDDPRNEYKAVEILIAQALGKPSHWRSPVSLPVEVLEWLQRLRGGDYSPPRRKYLSQDVTWRKRTRGVDFGDAIQEFARHTARTIR